MSVETASTAMGVCASHVPLDRSRMTIRVAAICAWRWARTSTAPTVCRALAALPVVSPWQIAPDVSCVLREARPMYRPLGPCVLDVSRVRSPMLLALAALDVHLDRRTRSGIAQTAVPANDAIQGQSPTQPARRAMHAWASTRRMAVSVWTVRTGRSRLQ